MMDWDQYFLELADKVSEKSKDRSTKVGCVVIGPDHEIRSTGYNNFPRGCDDELEKRHQRPEKYLWIEHAERNAIYNAARTGTSLKGCTMYLNWFPCMDCARGIVQSGIKEIVCTGIDLEDERWGTSFQKSLELFVETGVFVRNV